MNTEKPIVPSSRPSLLKNWLSMTGLVVNFSENVLCAGELPGVHETVNVSPAYDLGATEEELRARYLQLFNERGASSPSR